jgi:hypothetical protein
MADTQRTIAGLKAILPDNTSGDISPQDLRDFVESVRPGFSEMYVSTPAGTTINTPGTFEKVAGTTTLASAPTPVNWSMPADNRLRYDGVADRVVRVSASISVTIPSGSNKELRFRFAKNGTTQVDSEARQFMVVNSQVENVAVLGIFQLSTNDYIEVFCTNITDTISVDVNSMVVDAISMPF